MKKREAAALHSGNSPHAKKLFERRELNAKSVSDLISLQAEQGDQARVRVVFDTRTPSFAVRLSPNGGATFCMVYSMGGKSYAYTIGKFRTPELAGQAGGRGITAAEARKVASTLRGRIDAGENIAESKVTERENAKAERKAKAERAAIEKRKAEATLLGLLEAYVDHLKAEGKPTWKEVNRAIKRHISKRRKLASTPAEDVEIDDVSAVLQALAKAGKYNEARKLNAYMRAAYTLARRARTDAGLHAFAGFVIRTNPLSDLKVSRPKEAAERAVKAAKERKWALSEAQLAAYWARIKELDTPHGAALRFHLLTGGQRIEQLSRLELHDHDADAGTVTIRDTKGRRSAAYDHVLPLLPDAVTALAAMRDDKPAGDYMFTVTNGRKGAVYGTVRDALREVAEAMVEAGEIDRMFTPGTIRKTVETRLAAAGISKEHRARLQSHGLGGVQDTFYDAHGYLDEKRAALRKLRSLCEPKGKPGNVTPIRRKA